MKKIVPVEAQTDCQLFSLSLINFSATEFKTFQCFQNECLDSYIQGLDFYSRPNFYQPYFMGLPTVILGRSAIAPAISDHTSIKDLNQIFFHLVLGPVMFSSIVFLYLSSLNFNDLSSLLNLEIRIQYFWISF